MSTNPHYRHNWTNIPHHPGSVEKSQAGERGSSHMLSASGCPLGAAAGVCLHQGSSQLTPLPLGEMSVCSSLGHLSHHPDCCLITSLEALSSSLVPTAHTTDVVGEAQPGGIKEQKYKYLWLVGRRLISHVAGKTTVIPLLPPQPQLVLRLSCPLFCLKKSQPANGKLLHSPRTTGWILRNIPSND